MQVHDGPAVSAGFHQFYEREHGGQVRRAYLLVGSNDAANDIVHDAMVAVLRRWSDLSDPGAYLNRCVLNGCRDDGRRHGRQQRLIGRIARDRHALGVSRSERDVLDDVLAALPFNQRAAVVLRFYGGMTNDEIAGVLGCPTGSVGPWIDRAMRTLRKDLS